MPARTALPSLPYGSWPSDLRAADVAAGSLRLSQVRIHAGRFQWVEGRPAEGGRQVVCAAAPGEIPIDLTPAKRSARARVHEYGGGDYAVTAHGLFFVDDREGGIHRQRPGATRTEPVRGTASDARYADLAVSPDGRWLVAVEERPRAGREEENRLLAFPLAGGAPPVAFASSHDFVSSPCFAPDGSRLAYLCWDHPDMPWDAAALRELPFGADGPASAARDVAGGPRESVFQPGYSPGGRLTFISDCGGWWNPRQLREGGVVTLHERQAEFGLPQWVFGMSTWAFLSEDALVCVVREAGRSHVMRLDLASGALTDLGLPLVSVSSVAADGRRVGLIGATPDRPEAVFALDLADGRLECLRSSASLELEPGDVSVAESLTFPTGEGERAHAFYYAPRSQNVRAPSDGRPPLLVKIHGGPSAAASAGLDYGVQYWTQRGFGVVDVDHRGSTGFGRSYRERLYGAWGLVDVEDCVAVAEFLVAEGRADPERLAIRGGSAGGFTTLAALTFHDRFTVGCSRYGIGDLEALAGDTHKFEARYVEKLVAPWPAGCEVYRARSPLRHVERLSRPVIFFQGLEDRVVPPNQTEAMVAALAERDIPHAYVAFAGEGHGFRSADNLVTSLEGELYFYGRILGFDAGVSPAGVEVRGGQAQR